MTLEEYKYYSSMTRMLFDYMNGKINIMNSNCALYIDMYDYVNNTYANIRYPNFIFIHIGNIIDAWEDEWSLYLNKDSYIVSTIAWSLSHELHHADQLISMLQYNSNPSYRKTIEGAVERAAYDWVCNHEKELSQVTGIPIIIRELTSDGLPETSDYRRASVEQFYKQTIANVIIRDMDTYNQLKVFTDDTISDDIILVFSGNERISIKQNGKYVPDNINEFSRLVYKYAGYWDTYSIDAYVTLVKKESKNEGKTTAFVFLTISNALIQPLIFK